MAIDRTMGNYVIKQLGGFDHLHRSCGFREFTSLPAGIQFRVVHLHRKATHVRIALSSANVCSVSLVRISSPTEGDGLPVLVDSASCVAIEDLRAVLGSMVGLAGLI